MCMLPDHIEDQNSNKAWLFSDKTDLGWEGSLLIHKYSLLFEVKSHRGFLYTLRENCF